MKENSQRDQRKKKKVVILIGILVCILVAAGISGVTLIFNRQKATQEAALLLQEDIKKQEELKKEKQQNQEAARDRFLENQTESGINVFDSIKKRPPSEELPSDDPTMFAQITSCAIDTESSIIRIKVSADAIPVSDDKKYYLFALKMYETEIGEEAAPILEEYKDLELEFRPARHFTGTESGAFYKFAVAVKKDDRYVRVSNMHFITNPESVAKYISNGEEAASKKGLLIDPSKIRTTELEDLGVKQAAYNIPISRILGESTSSTYPTIHYSYNGKSYSFNGQVMSEYDLVFSTLSSKGIVITAIILNDVSLSNMHLIHPKARAGIGSAPYYAFNATDKEGVEHLSAIGAFLAERYSGSANGRGMVSNWIIGNEINARKEWNYMEYTDLKTYVREYAKAFRVFYNAIKSINSASNIYISLDQQWNRNISSSTNYDSRDILDEFNSQIKREGNIDWGLAIHPYNAPLTTPYTWKDSKYIKDSVDTSMLSMANIHVVTDYLQQKEFLTESGEVRSVTLSELGYTSVQGEEVQAAAIAYGYKVAQANPHIDSYLLSRETDALEEVVQGLAFGLNNVDGSHKYAWNVYKYMDTEQEESYTSFAKSMIGIDSWSEIIK